MESKITKNSCLNKKWQEKLDQLDVAFQPIINIHTGKLFAVEALLRNFRDIGFHSIFSVFDTVYKEGILYCFDLELRKKALQKFTQIEGFENLKLFYNLDNRLFDIENFSSGNTMSILQELGIKRENICFEISERHEITDSHSMERVLQHYKEEEYSIAIDDFGVGYSGYKLLFDSTPDFIKIDRYFLQDIEKNMKKKLMVKGITHLAIQLGIQVLAEGVETKAEYLTCKDIGCQLVQGYLVQRPTQNVEEILESYPHITQILKNSKRDEQTSHIKRFIQKISPIYNSYSMDEVVSYFQQHKNKPIVPIVNKNQEAIGLFYESSIKEYLYSPYGMSLLLNNTNKHSKLKNFINFCPVTDINSSITTIIELFSNNPNANGILITKNSKYYGFLSANNIINMMNEENLIIARDQNPLTKLPGNRLVEKYIADSTNNKEDKIMLCYFDLDNFKAFNDKYGFRLGDRVIQLFADTINKKLPKEYFKGHIGGDDFFVATRYTTALQDTFIQIANIIERFSDNVREFYTPEDKKRGYIISKDREGKEKRFKLLTVSASMLLLNESSNSYFSGSINDILSIQKKVAKQEEKHIAISSLL